MTLRTEETPRDESLFYDSNDNGWSLPEWCLVERASKHDSPTCDADYWTENEALAVLSEDERVEAEANQGGLPEPFERLPMSTRAGAAVAMRRAA